MSENNETKRLTHQPRTENGVLLNYLSNILGGNEDVKILMVFLLATLPDHLQKRFGDLDRKVSQTLQPGQSLIGHQGLMEELDRFLDHPAVTEALEKIYTASMEAKRDADNFLKTWNPPALNS